MVSNWNEEGMIQRGFPAEKLVACTLLFGLLLYLLYYYIEIMLDERKKVKVHLENLNTHLKMM